MKPPPFEYVDPESLAEALDVLATEDDVAILAGGQSLVPMLNLRLARPAVVLDVRRLAELSEVTIADATVVVGARVTATALLARADVGAVLPGLRQAVREIGHPQIRNRTTIGGSIAHADPAAELPAVLVGTGGEVEVTSRARGTRRVAADDFFAGPLMTNRADDELVTAVRFPIPDGPSVWLEQARRPGDFALVGVFASRSGVGLAGVGARPVGGIGADVDEVIDRLDPVDDVHASAAHRRALAIELGRRALRDVA